MAKPKEKSRIKRLVRYGLKGALWTTGLALLALITLPYWLGAALKVFLPRELIQFEDYQTDGYGRFNLIGVDATTKSVRVRMDTIRAPSPLSWVASVFGDGFERTVLEIGTVVVDIDETENSETEGQSASAPRSLLEVLEMLEQPLGVASKWLPSARIEKVVINAFGHTAELNDLAWRDLKLELKGVYSERPNSIAVIKASISRNAVSLEVSIPNDSLSLRSSLARVGDVASLSNHIVFRGNDLSFDAEFGKESWIPSIANWRADSWKVGNEDLGLDVLYTDFQLDLEGAWENGRFANSVEGSASMDDGGRDLPDVNFDSSIKGDLKHVEMDAFSLNAPGLIAVMKQPVRFDYSTKRLDGEFLFDLDFDLSLLKIENLGGRLLGTLRLETDDLGKPIGHFQLAGRDIVYRENRIGVLNMDTDLNWPILRANRIEVEFSRDSNLRLTGEFNLAEKTTISSSVEGELDSDFMTPFFPEGFSVERLGFDMSASGPWSDTAHQGKIVYSILDTPTLKPLSGEASWLGSNASLDNIELTGDNGDASFSMSGRGSYLNSEIQFSFEELVLLLGGVEMASLQGPAQLHAKLGDKVQAKFSGFRLKGPGGEVDLDFETSFPDSAIISARIENLDTGNWRNPWIEKQSEPAEIKSASLAISWNDGPVTGGANVDAWFTVGAEALYVVGDLNLFDDNIEIGDFEIADRSGSLVTIKGKAPYSISSNAENWVNVNGTGPLSLSLISKNSPTLVEFLSEALPFDLDSFEANIELGGSIAKPSGTTLLKLKTREGEGEHGLPSAMIELIGGLEGPDVDVSRVHVEVLEQKFDAFGQVSLPDDVLKYLILERPDIDWGDTGVSVSVPDSSMAPLAFFVPSFLRPDGSLKGELKGDVRNGFNGSLAIKGLNTRPIFPFGSMREIDSRLVFDKSVARLESFSGKVGREPLLMEGVVDYSNLADPLFELRINGKNLPMIRRPGLLQRADLDLSIDKTDSKPAIVSGTIGLKDGLFLLDTSVLVGPSSGGGRSAESRPPYFSVDVPPMRDWKLDIELKGERFLNLRTPAATGELSMDMNLGGTFAEPFLQGQVIYDRGTLVFPFASFSVEQGLVELRIDDPYTPLLNIIGISKRLGYDLSVEITGTAFDPQIRFTSSPPLSSEQIIMMVMAGENPNDNFSYSTSQRASKIGSYLSKGLFSSGSSNEGIGSRLSLSSGENLSRQGKETIEIEVLLDEQFQVVGEYDEYDAWNAGLRWRFFGRDKKEAKDE